MSPLNLQRASEVLPQDVLRMIADDYADRIAYAEHKSKSKDLIDEFNDYFEIFRYERRDHLSNEYDFEFDTASEGLRLLELDRLRMDEQRHYFNLINYRGSRIHATYNR